MILIAGDLNRATYTMPQESLELRCAPVFCLTVSH
jgi:hypothetical protein